MLNNESENEKELIPIKIGDDRTIWMLGNDAQAGIDFNRNRIETSIA